MTTTNAIFPRGATSVVIGKVYIDDTLPARIKGVMPYDSDIQTSSDTIKIQDGHDCPENTIISGIDIDPITQRCTVTCKYVDTQLGKRQDGHVHFSPNKHPDWVSIFPFDANAICPEGSLITGLGYECKSPLLKYQCRPYESLHKSSSNIWIVILITFILSTIIVFAMTRYYMRKAV